VGCGSSSGASGDPALAASATAGIGATSTSSSLTVGTISRPGSSAGGGATVALPASGAATSASAAASVGAESGATATSPATAATTTATTTVSPTAPAPVNPHTSPTVAATPAGAGSAPAQRRSITAWVACTGTSDDSAGVAKALAAARNGAFILVVDCPVTIKIGTDIARTLFIDNGTTVEFTGNGKFTVDDVQIPAFVIADSSDITLTDWNVQYDASLPVNDRIGYEDGGQSNDGKAGNAFNDVRLTQWLAANRAIVFDNSQGSVHAQWSGETNACAVFYITGDATNVNVTGMHLYVPANAGGERFIPVAFAVGTNFRRNQTVTANMPLTAQNFAIPQNLTFSNITLDGTYMGWVGGLKNSVFENIQSNRYGDQQDAAGNNVGGVGKWFAPPHLFYFNYQVDVDPALFNSNIQIRQVVDNGLRVGKARDAGGKDTISGYANSLKLGCVDCSVDGYQSYRPDGFMDVLTSDGLTVSNATATYDSAFTNNLYPGWRFPSAAYKNLKFENISLQDSAAVTIVGPIGNANVVGANRNLVFSNVHVGINLWDHSVAPFPYILGEDDSLAFIYSMGNDRSQHLQSVTNNVQLQFLVSPATVHVGQTTSLTWLSWQANSCSAAGAWTAALATTGSRELKMTTPGTYNFTLSCRNAQTTTSATAKVVVSL
jgi:hypothetical protein